MSAQPYPDLDDIEAIFSNPEPQLSPATGELPKPSLTLVQPLVDDEYIEDAEDILAGSAFHCCSEYHTRRIGSELASTIYTHGLKLSRKSGVYCPSIRNLAGLMNCKEDAIRRGFKALVKVGLFELKKQGVCSPSIFTILTHKEWAAKNPGQCVQKIEYVWSDEGDKLGQYISAQTGFQIKILEFQIKNIRKLNLSDDEVIARFDEYYGSIGQHRLPKNVVSGFYIWLKSRC